MVFAQTFRSTDSTHHVTISITHLSLNKPADSADLVHSLRHWLVAQELKFLSFSLHQYRELLINVHQIKTSR
jgi:hypothetical protein